MISSRAYPLKVDGLNSPLELWLHDQRDQHVSKDIIDNGIWESFETRLVIERLGPDSVFVDVGANLGYYSVIAADQIGSSGSIIAFEPDPDNFLLLEKNLQHNSFPFVEAVNAGLSDQAREGMLYLNESNLGDHRIYDNGDGRSSRPIALVNGNDYLSSKLSCIDLLKIDTQGAESQVIAGLMPLLQRSGDKLRIIIEFWPYGLRKAGSSADLLLDMLVSLNLPFSIVDHVGHELIPASEQQLREWIEMVEKNPEDEGFMNIFLGR